MTRKIVEWDEYTGRFDAMESVDIRARVSGYLNEVHFKDGQIVKKGDMLYSIDPRPFERALEQAKAELAQASTKIENTALDVERGKPAGRPQDHVRKSVRRPRQRAARCAGLA